MNNIGYLVTLVLSLALLVLLALSWFDVTRATLRLSKLWLILAVSAILVATTVRVIPGGPFLSIHGDILPILSCVALFVIASIALPRSSVPRRMLLISAMLGSLGLTGLIVAKVVSFWREPFARGELVGW